ncbi:MAG: hypothetical protein HQ510_11700 [Candidatus Marinimicrobia bacterium]|nr:hypothetical protein [Candidatus Neomarinimicrobiota bacterium]
MKSTKELLKVIEKRKPEGIGLNPQSPPVRSIMRVFQIQSPIDIIPEMKKKINLKNLLPKK